MGMEGEVKIRFLINKEGDVSHIEILAPNPSKVFDQSLLNAVSSWKYAPGELMDKKVATRITTSIIFNLGKMEAAAAFYEKPLSCVRPMPRLGRTWEKSAKALVLNKKDAKSLFMHGLCACRAGHTDQARKILKQAAAHRRYKTQAMALIRQMDAADATKGEFAAGQIDSVLMFSVHRKCKAGVKTGDKY